MNRSEKSLKAKNNKRAFTKTIIHFAVFLILYFINCVPGANPYIAPALIYILLLIIKSATSHRDIPKRRGNVLLFFSIGIISAAFYYAIIYMIHAEHVTISDTRLVQSMSVLLYLGIILQLITLMDDVYEKFEDKIAVLFRVAAIQGLICLVMLIMPQLKNLANAIYLASTDQFKQGAYIFTTRIYGISNDYTYGMPILHGMLCGLDYYYGITRNKKLLKYLPLIFIVTILNGRTGIIISIATITIATVMLLFQRTKNKFRVLVSFAVIAVTAVLALTAIKNLAPNAYKFINQAYTEIISYVKYGELSGTTKYLVEDRFFMPNGIDLIFGTGTRVYGQLAVSTKSSDIGYVNDLFMGGIIYATILYVTFLRLILKTNKNKTIPIVIVVTSLIIANWKGEAFRCPMIIIGLLLYQLIAMYDLNKVEGTTINYEKPNNNPSKRENN